MPRCRFETLAGSGETLVRPYSRAILTLGHGPATDHSDPAKCRPHVDTYVAHCRGECVEPFTLRVTVSQPDDCAFHCKGNDRPGAVCEGETLKQGHTWKRRVEPTFGPQTDEYTFDVFLCYASAKQYGVLRMTVVEDIPETINRIALRVNKNRPVPKEQELEVILEGP